MKVLIVCLGNICRSPMAEGVLRRTAEEAGLDWHVDSAGTSGWHNGEPPDRRAIATCRKNGIDISGQRSRQLLTSDFDDFHVILTMDESNYQNVMRMAPRDLPPARVKRILDFSPEGVGEVPDPYYDGRFDEVFAILEDVSQHVVAQLRDGA